VKKHCHTAADVMAELELIDTTVTRVDDPIKIRHHIPLDGVPGLLIDGRLVSQGHLPSRDERAGMIQARKRRLF